MSFGALHDSLFRQFGVAGVVTHKDTSTTAVEVVVRFGVDAIDEYGEVMEKIDRAMFRASVVTTKQGEILTVSTGEFAGVYELGRMLKNNGYVIGRVITKQSSA